jgi:hypothetical protein
MSESNGKKRGFAAMSPDLLRQIASSGGIAQREAYKQARQNGQSGDSLPVSLQPKRRLANPPGP